MSGVIGGTGTEEDKTIMRIIDEVYTMRPYFGRPRITNALRQDYGYLNDTPRRRASGN